MRNINNFISNERGQGMLLLNNWNKKCTITIFIYQCAINYSILNGTAKMPASKTNLFDVLSIPCAMFWEWLVISTTSTSFA